MHTLASFRTLLERYEDIGDAASAVREHVLGELTALPGLPDLPGKEAPRMVEVLVSNIFRGLQTRQSHLYRDVALHTQMAPHLQTLAQTCIERMGQRSASFVGIHLRIEGDFEKMERTGGEPPSRLSSKVRAVVLQPELGGTPCHMLQEVIRHHSHKMVGRSLPLLRMSS